MNVVITGASKGIGKATALKFAAEGHSVAICAREEASLKAVVASSVNGNIIYKCCDVSKRAELADFYEFVSGHFKNTDILINNAGTFLPGSIHEEGEGLLEKLIETNLYSAYNLTRFFLPAMMTRKQGHIFNMCSTASIVGYTSGGSYCISKFALYGMNKVLREELKPYNIKVTAVLPGATLTDSWSGVDLPESRFMKPEDVADIIYATALLSPSAVIEEILMRPLEGDI